MNLLLPSVEVVELIHETVLMLSGGKGGIHRKSELEAAVSRPKTYMGYVDDYDLHSACAVLLDSLARNHCFNDGNKRTALLTMLFTYQVNDVNLNMNLYMNDDFEALVLWVVNEKPEIPNIRNKLLELTKKYSYSLKVLPMVWLKKFFT